MLAMLPEGVDMDDKLDLGNLADVLAKESPVKAPDLADNLKIDYKVVRDALVRLEDMGIVYRTGKTRGTRWWLG